MTTFDCSELCRLCLVKDRVKVPIFEGEGDARQVSFKIGTCLPIKVTREDRFPKQVCEDCINKLDLVYDFWTTTVNSERQLSQWVGDAGDGEDKQGYVSITDELMKQETAENRLMEGSVMNQNDQNTNININMMDQMGLTMPIIISNNQQQQQQQHQQMTMQGVSGTSSDANQRGNKRHHEEVEASDDEGDIEGLDNDDAVKSEDIDGTSNRPTGHEPTFVSIACDDGAGPSGLQQQKMDMSDMIMTQADVDPKSGLKRPNSSLSSSSSSSSTAESGIIFTLGKIHMTKSKKIYGKSHWKSIQTMKYRLESASNVETEALPNERPQEGALKCKYCDVHSYSQPQYVAHLRLHEQYICLLCERTYMDPVEFTVHQQMHLREYTFCDECDYSTTDRNSLVDHMTIHAPARPATDPYICTICKETFTVRVDLTVHELLEHRVLSTQAPNQCTICGSVKPNPAAYRMHVITHRVNKRYKCDLCPKTFHTMSPLKLHRRRHK